MIHFNDLMENKTVLECNNLNGVENTNFYWSNLEFKLETSNLLLVLNQSHYYYDYFIPISFDKIDNIEIDSIEYAELFINDTYSCPVDNALEIVACSTYSQFGIRVYFTKNFPLPETITIKYNAYVFPYQFRQQISVIPFQTDTHTYIDGVINIL
jgi:hypothetical protein